MLTMQYKASGPGNKVRTAGDDADMQSWVRIQPLAPVPETLAFFEQKTSNDRHQ